ncbi:MAG: M20/M25/M40 family metallo-hydrolase [Planctomycetota bacterium]
MLRRCRKLRTVLVGFGFTAGCVLCGILIQQTWHSRTGLLPRDAGRSAAPLANIQWLLPLQRDDDPARVESRLLKSVRYLASDDLEGRGIGTTGLDLAADYIAKEFDRAGLDTTLFAGSPFQVLTGSDARALTTDDELEGGAAPRQPQVLKNVVGALAGGGDFGDETIVLGAHYDHLGYGGEWGSLAPWTHDIHNGADDNASGTAVMLEVARQFAASDEKLRRRVLFVAFTAEESGLIGSEYFVRTPFEPISNYIAMINLDMVGYLRSNLEVSGTGTAREFESLVGDLGSKHSLRLVTDPGGYGPSDHASFHAKGIPVLHLFTGFHENYHRPSDDAEKLNIAGMRQVTQFTVDLIIQLANAEQRPQPSSKEVGNIRYEFARRTNTKSDLGIQPDPAYLASGVRVQKVATRSAADRAGIRPGDVIVKLNQTAVRNVDELHQATLATTNADTLRIHVQRAAFVMELELPLRP